MGVPDHHTCPLKNLQVGQEATVKTLCGRTDWLKIGKGVWEDCILSPSLFNFYAEHIMQNARLNESQAGIKTARRNINHLRNAEYITPVAESEEDWKNLLMRVKEESEKAGLNSTFTKLRSRHSVSSLLGK